MISEQDLLSTAQRVHKVIQTEEFSRVVDFIVDHQILLTGTGKSGLVAQRAAATLRSIGLEAWYESTTDLMHGGLGGTDEYTFLFLSHSGQTTETVDLARHIGTRLHNMTIVISAYKNSPLTHHADLVLPYGEVLEPAEVNGLPILACWAQTMILDCIAVAAADRVNFTDGERRIYHPGGTIA